MNILSYTVLYTILYTVVYTILDSILYTVLTTILYIMLYKEIKVICFSQEHYPSYLLYNILNTTIYTVFNTLLCIVVYSILFKNIQSASQNFYSLRNSFFIASMRYWTLYCLTALSMYSNLIQFGEIISVYSKICT